MGAVPLVIRYCCVFHIHISSFKFSYKYGGRRKKVPRGEKYTPDINEGTSVFFEKDIVVGTRNPF